METVPEGAVFAAGVEAIQIRVSNPLAGDNRPARLSVVASDNDSRRLAPPGSIVIATSPGAGLPAMLLPMAGNQAWMERIDATPGDAPAPMFPSSDRALVIAVWVQKNPWVRVAWQNVAGGSVEGARADGSTQLLGTVVRPLEGVGRYDGTPVAGHGRVAMVQPGAWVVSTVPRVKPGGAASRSENRGGFQVAVVRPGATLPRADAGLAMTLATGVAGLDSVSVWSQDVRWECRIDDSPWMALPTATGPRIRAFTGDDWSAAPYRLAGRPIRRGITALRVHLATPNIAELAKLVDELGRADRLRRAAEARRRGTPVVSGRYVVRVRPTDPSRVRFVRLSVDGRVVAFSNVAPFDLPWDTTRVGDGEYALVVEILDQSGAAIATTTQSVVVDNTDRPDKNR